MMLKDIILVPNYQAIPAAGFPSLPVDLGRGVRLEKLPQDWAKMVMDACEPPGWNAPPAQRHGDLYAFVRQDPPAGSTLWDPDDRLQECIAISRLTRPTSIGFKYSAQLRLTLDGELKSIFPGPVDGFGAYAWIVQTNHDWLDQTDVTALGELWRQTHLSSLPDRLWRALWYHEYAARTELPEIRCVLVVTGIEALINTKKNRVSKQFEVRFPKLAERFASLQVSALDAKDAYALRSEIAHGTKLGGLTNKHLRLYSCLEEVLRATVRTGISRQDVRLLFASDEAVEQEWPLKSNA